MVREPTSADGGWPPAYTPYDEIAAPTPFRVMAAVTRCTVTPFIPDPVRPLHPPAAPLALAPLAIL